MPGKKQGTLNARQQKLRDLVEFIANCIVSAEVEGYEGMEEDDAPEQWHWTGQHLYFMYKGQAWQVTNERSSSLKLGPGDGDNEILTLFLDAGIAGLDLANMMTYREIQRLKGS